MPSTSHTIGQGSSAPDKSAYDRFVENDGKFRVILGLLSSLLQTLDQITVQPGTEQARQMAKDFLDNIITAWNIEFPGCSCPNILLENKDVLMEVLVENNLSIVFQLLSNCPKGGNFLTSGSRAIATTRAFAQQWESLGLPLNIAAPVTTRLFCQHSDSSNFSGSSSGPTNCCNHEDPAANSNVYKINSLWSLLIATWLFKFSGKKVVKCLVGAVARVSHDTPRHGRYQGVLALEKQYLELYLSPKFLAENKVLLCRLIDSVYSDTGFAIPHPSRMWMYPLATNNAWGALKTFLAEIKSPYNLPRDGIRSFNAAVGIEAEDWFLTTAAAVNFAAPLNQVASSALFSAPPRQNHYSVKLEQFLQLVDNVGIEKEEFDRLRNVPRGGARARAIGLAIDVALEMDWDAAEDEAQLAIALLPVLACMNVMNNMGGHIVLETAEQMANKLGQLISFIMALVSGELDYLTIDQLASKEQQGRQRETLVRAVDVCGTSTGFIALLATRRGERLASKTLTRRIIIMNQSNQLNTEVTPAPFGIAQQFNGPHPAGNLASSALMDSEEGNNEDPPSGVGGKRKRRHFVGTDILLSEAIAYLNGIDTYAFGVRESVPWSQLFDHLVASGSEQINGVANHTKLSERLNKPLRDVCIDMDGVEILPEARGLSENEKFQRIYLTFKDDLVKKRKLDRVSVRREGLKYGLQKSVEQIIRAMGDIHKNGSITTSIHRSKRELDALWNGVVFPFLQKI